jgi:hypothetical protein
MTMSPNKLILYVHKFGHKGYERARKGCDTQAISQRKKKLVQDLHKFPFSFPLSPPHMLRVYKANKVNKESEHNMNEGSRKFASHALCDSIRMHTTLGFNIT